MNSWPMKTIASLCERITSGGTPSRKSPDFYTSAGGHPWVKSGELLDRKITQTEERISDEGLANSSAKYLPQGTVLMAMYGANVGQLGILGLGATLNQAVCGMVPKEGVCDPLFLFYCLKANRDELVKRAHGAAQQNLSATLIKQFSLPVPPLETQHRIAFVLGAYDDLIEANRRRIAVLEEMTRRLFEEWFVRFRFPGHEVVPILDTPDGPLPEGWMFAPLDSFVVLQRGFDLPKSDRTDGVVPVFSASGFHGGHNEHKVSGPGLVTGRSGTIGPVHLVMEDFWPLNTTLYVREFRRAGPAYGLCLLRHMNLAKHSSGAAVPTLNRNHIHNIKMPAAPQSLIDRFESFAFANLQLIRLIQGQNELLTASRDLLLPRLISGQLSVTEVGRELDEAA